MDRMDGPTDMTSHHSLSSFIESIMIPWKEIPQILFDYSCIEVFKDVQYIDTFSGILMNTGKVWCASLQADTMQSGNLCSYPCFIFCNRIITWKRNFKSWRVLYFCTGLRSTILILFSIEHQCQILTQNVLLQPHKNTQSQLWYCR
jgi:hypothetical protein